MSAGRTIVIGDIHGCADELRRLLEACNAGEDDEIVSVGDLVDRGPDPIGVVRFFMNDPRCVAILGNHEDKHVRGQRDGLTLAISQRICREQLGELYDGAVVWFETLPLFLVRHGCWIVHGGVQPGLEVSDQPRQALLRAKMPWMRNQFDRNGPDWRLEWDRRAPVIFGHRVVHDVGPVNDTWGLDTGACHGGKLTALLLPEFRVVQVDATRDYWTEIRERHRIRQG